MMTISCLYTEQLLIDYMIPNDSKCPLPDFGILGITLYSIHRRGITVFHNDRFKA